MLPEKSVYRLQFVGDNTYEDNISQFHSVDQACPYSQDNENDLQMVLKHNGERPDIGTQSSHYELKIQQ